MITIEKTTDDDYIKSVLFDPQISQSMRDDSVPDPEKLRHVNILAIPSIFLKVLYNGVAAGLFWMIPKGDTFECHTALLPNCRGRCAIRAAIAAKDWIFNYTTAREITSYAWSDSPEVAWFCRAIGMRKLHTAPWPNTRNGKPVDITYYAIGRNE